MRLMPVKEKIKVVDNYFPEWFVTRVSHELEFMPVRYNNTPYANFRQARFFGATLMQQDRFLDIPPWWVVEYFNECMYHDICKEWTTHACLRVLLNGQLPGQHGCNHTDSDSNNYLSVIYHGHGVDGDTVFVDNDTGEDIQRVSFKEGRLVIFNSLLMHRSDAPSQGYRVTLGGVYPSVPITTL